MENIYFLQILQSAVISIFEMKVSIMFNNESNSSAYIIVDENQFMKYMRSSHFVLLCMGSLFNLLLVKLLTRSRRRKCTTLLLLTLMALCDCVYCSVNLSIKLTIDQYINIINHQILCPLSFFLIPFTFTGSTLLLLICLIHLASNYIRKYDTISGQLCGPLSAVFILAFVLIRSVLGTTSVELLVIDPKMSDLHYCTIDMNTTLIVNIMQDVVHVFADVTDIFIYLLWIIIALKFLVNVIRSKHSPSERISLSAATRTQMKRRAVIVYDGDDLCQEKKTTTINIPIKMSTALTKNTSLNKYRHSTMSLIILSITICSTLLYLPIMIGKYSTLHLIFFEKPLFDSFQTNMLQTLQNTAHSLCLSIRFLPYILVNRRIRRFVVRICGIADSSINESSL